MRTGAAVDYFALFCMFLYCLNCTQPAYAHALLLQFRIIFFCGMIVTQGTVETIRRDSGLQSGIPKEVAIDQRPEGSLRVRTEMRVGSGAGGRSWSG